VIDKLHKIVMEKYYDLRPAIAAASVLVAADRLK
jgi:hypothetical protein